ncbi:MAG: BrnA antitoxin family protein [Gammaproteobacteria bacterium]
MNMPSNLDDPIDYSDIPKQTTEQIRQFKPMQDASPALYRKMQTAHMGKTVITIQLDNEVLDWFRNHVIQADGGNYQALINDALREYIRGTDLKATLRQIIREEMKAAG